MCNASNHSPGCTCGFGGGYHAGGYNDESWHEQLHPAYVQYGSSCSWNPTSCPICGSDVYFLRHNGGSVWLDELGDPWPKHPCFDDEYIAGLTVFVDTDDAGGGGLGVGLHEEFFSF